MNRGGTVYMLGEREEVAIFRLVTASAAQTARRHAQAMLENFRVDASAGSAADHRGGEMVGIDRQGQPKTLTNLADAVPERIGRTRIVMFVGELSLYLQVEMICEVDSVWLDYQLAVEKNSWSVVLAEISE